MCAGCEEKFKAESEKGKKHREDPSGIKRLMHSTGQAEGGRQKVAHLKAFFILSSSNGVGGAKLTHFRILAVLELFGVNRAYWKIRMIKYGSEV